MDCRRLLKLLSIKVKRLKIAKQFGREFFDGEREYDYGGYVHDGRWKSVVKGIKKYWTLSDDFSVLDVGCGKGVPVCISTLPLCNPEIKYFKRIISASSFQLFSWFD